MGQRIKPNKQFGNHLRSIRIASHYTQQQLTTFLQLRGFDLSRSIYSQMETGAYNIEIRMLYELASIYQIDFNGLFTGQYTDKEPFVPKNFLDSLAQPLKYFREKAGLTQRKLVKQLTSSFSITQPFYCGIEKGKYNIRIELLVALLELYNITYNDIFLFHL